MLKIMTKLTALAVAATAICSSPSMAFDQTTNDYGTVQIGACTFQASYTGASSTAMVAVQTPGVVPVVDSYISAGVVPAGTAATSANLAANCLPTGTISNFSATHASLTVNYAQATYIGFSFDYIDPAGGAWSYEVAVSGENTTTLILIADQNPLIPTSNPEQDVISGFMLGRADSLAVNQPGLMRFLNQGQCGAFDANIQNGAGSVDGCLSHGNTWAEITGSWTKDSEYTLGTVGTHRAINSNLIIGGMLQFDHASYEADVASVGHAEISGHGWMAGPYFAAKLRDDSIFLEGRLLYGQTDNDITLSNMIGSYSDSFKTERMLAQFRATGKYQVQNTTLMPLIDFTYTNDTQESYVNALGNTIDQQSVNVTQLTAGLDFSTPIEVQTGSLEFNGGLSGIYSASHGTSNDSESVRGRLELGLDYNMGKNTTLNVSTFYDGIGSDVNARGVTLGFDVSF